MSCEDSGSAQFSNPVDKALGLDIQTQRQAVDVKTNDVAIKVQAIGKCYQIYDSPLDRLKQFLFPRAQLSLDRKPKRYFREFWAIENVSFEIKKGETVGIIGRNGSGKSTLLQIICGTLTPTKGIVETNGRISALLELGSGFNPEFTGRENVYMNAAILGLGKMEIDEKFSDIAAFAEIGQFIDQPVKTYSSGMVVRLGFAVAINVDPEILVVDEALSVGDELFQRKCFARIENIRAKGATILFVSHSAGAIVELCDRAILMDEGEKLAEGPAKQIVGQYQKLIYAPVDRHVALREKIRQTNGQLQSLLHTNEAFSQKTPASSEHVVASLESFDPHLVPTSTIAYESHGALIQNPVVLNLAGEKINSLIGGHVYRYVYTVKFVKSASNVRFGMLIKTISGVELGGGLSAKSLEQSVTYVEAGAEYQVEFRFKCALNPGVYFLNAGVIGSSGSDETFLHRLIDIAMFRVMPNSEILATGIVDFNCYPEIERLPANL